MGDDSSVPQLSFCAYYPVATLIAPKSNAKHTTFYTLLSLIHENEVLAELLHQLVPGGGDMTLPALAAFAPLPAALQKMKPAIQSTLLHFHPF